MSESRPSVRITNLPRAQAPVALALDQWAFGHDMEGAPVDEIVGTLDWDRFYGAFVPPPGARTAPPQSPPQSPPQENQDGDPDHDRDDAGPEAERLAGVYSAYSVNCPLPFGNSVPAAALTWVGVHPRDRRRGVLTAMIRHHLDDVLVRRGEPFSILFAAEPAIYGRFGYGVAATSLHLEVPRGAALRDVPGSADLTADLEVTDPDRHAAPLAACFEAVAASRPGCIARPTPANQRFVLADPVSWRRGAETLRVLTVTAPGGELRGYALFRRRMNWDHGTPTGTVEVSEVMARDAAAAHALWSRLLDLDLTARVLTPPLPPDDALLHLLVDVRSARATVTDGLWLRLVDLPAAMWARRYATEVDVVVEVTDALLPANAGRWHLRGDAAGGACTRTDDAPHLTLDVRELGSAYLGGTTLTALAAAGLVTGHDPEALARFSTALGSPVRPWSAWSF